MGISPLTDLGKTTMIQSLPLNEDTAVSDGNSGSDKTHAPIKAKHFDASESLHNELTARGWQLLLIGEGLVCGGVADAGKELKVDNLWTVGGSVVAGGALGAVLGSKREMLKVAVAGIGAVGGWMYTASTFDKYSKNKELGKALDAVYKHGDWNTFNKQTKIAEKVLGKEGFDAGLAGISGSIGLSAGLKFAPGITRKLSPAAGEWMYGKMRGDKAVSGVRSTVTDTPLNRDLTMFVNKASHGDVHVASTAERVKTYIFDKDNRISNIFVHKTASPSEIERQIIIGSLADRIGRDKTALEIVMKGSEKANYHAPILGDLERSAAEGASYAESQVGSLRKLQGAHRYAIEGSEAYYRQKPGNDYTQYMRKVHGEWSAKKQREAHSSVMNIPVAETTDAVSHRIASENLAGVGIRPSDYNLAAAKNSHIQELNGADKNQAIRAVSYYLNGHPSNAKLTAANRIETLDQLARGLSAQQVELITSRVGDFDPQYFPHHLFEGSMLESVNSLVSTGLMKDATKTHRLLGRLTSQVNQPPNIKLAELFVACARNEGISEEQLMHKGTTEAAAKVLKELLSAKQEKLVSDLAIALKHLGQSTHYKDVAAVNTLRERGCSVEKITAETIAEFIARGF